MTATASLQRQVQVGDVVVLRNYVEWRCIVDDIKHQLRLVWDGDVATLLAIPRTTFNQWLKGGEPLYSHAEAVLQLHSMTCGAERTKLRLAEFRERATKAAP